MILCQIKSDEKVHFMITLSHKIEIKKPTHKQQKYFRQACGTARFAYNWGLEEWKKRYKAGQKPTAFEIAFNAIKPIEFPWAFNVTKCAPEQAFANHATPWARQIPKRKKADMTPFTMTNSSLRKIEFIFRSWVGSN